MYLALRQSVLRRAGLAAALVAGAIAWVLRDAPVVLSASLAGASYAGILLATGFVGANEMESLGLGRLAFLARGRGEAA